MIEILIAGLLSGVVSFRLWRLAALDTITEPLRHRLFGGSTVPAVLWIEQGVACAWCLGFWFNLALAPVLVDGWLPIASTALVGSTVTGLLDK